MTHLVFAHGRILNGWDPDTRRALTTRPRKTWMAEFAKRQEARTRAFAGPNPVVPVLWRKPARTAAPAVPGNWHRAAARLLDQADRRGDVFAEAAARLLDPCHPSATSP